jgi:signal transduction histidine kinase/serine/threonine protein kinase
VFATIPGYTLIEKLADTSRAVVYKALSKSAPGRPLVLKLLREGAVSERQKAYFRQRIEHLKILRDPALLTPLACETKGGQSFILQDFFDGVPLDEWASREQPVPLPSFFTLALSLAQAIEKIHEAGIIHGGIKPRNVLVRPGSLELRVIDFITPIDIREVSHFIYDRTFVRGTLPYTSPEQTGRIGHRVDFTTDLYSFGIVLWELLAGRPPFVSSDPLELIHAHLAEEPANLHELSAEIPEALANIVEKLTLKQPEKRYQSGAGVHADLLRCRDELAATGRISQFPLGSRDRTHRIIFISKMVGRDEEAQIILDEYEQVTRGQFRSLFISGLSGIGKTRLIQELQRPIVQHRGYFTSGKFDVYQKNIPYSSLIQAFKTLVRTLLTESDEHVDRWRGRLTAAVGVNGRVLTDVIPELELLIGPQPELAPLPPIESRNRFLDIFDRFLRCLASEETPLTLFIDDLQWCDVASFDFLRMLFDNHRDHPHLFFLGAYRHNEVDASHPLTKLLRSANEAGRPLREIRLAPLLLRHTHEMVSYILDSPPDQTEALATFIGGLAEGNPLFVSESLSYLHGEDLLLLDAGQEWRWDLAKIRGSHMPSTVVALFTSKVNRLPAETIELLQHCACMGNTFSPESLALIRETTLLGIFETLKAALAQGLIMEAKNQLQFIHDRVQEAVLASIPAARRREIHAEVGRHLIAAVPEGADLEKLDDLFAIVAHLNLGRERVLDRDAAFRLSDINFHAGQKALSSLATDAANDYFRLARELLPADAWDSAYEPVFEIYRKLAKTELMCGHIEASERLLDELLDHARTGLDKAQCLAEQTTSLSSIGDFIRAIETANRGLAFFEKSLPDDAAEADRRRAEAMKQIDAEGDVWSRILGMPFTSDRKSKIELAFYSELIPDLYMSGLVPQLYLSAAQSTQHCLAGGMDESVIYSFSIMGLQLGEAEDFERAFAYEDLARELSARHPSTFGATRGMNGIVWCNMHSRSHPEAIVAYCLQGIHCGKSCGDLYNAGLSYGPLMWNLQVQGVSFTAIEEYANECLAFSERFRLSFSVRLAKAMQAGWIAPMKKDYVPIPMDDEVRQWEAENHVAAAGSYYAHLALSHYYFGEHEEAHEALEKVRRYLTGMTDNVLKRQWYVFQVLNALARHERGAGAQSVTEVLAAIDPLVRKIETWAAMGPLLPPYLALIRADRARLSGGFEEVRSRLLDAIDIANTARYTFLEGYLHERLGDLLSEKGAARGRIYYQEAARLYRRCHAERKELCLVERLPDLVEEERAPSLATATEPLEPHVLPNLDVAYLMKSSLAMSAEIEGSALLRRIMKVVLEASGAQHGYLLVERGDGLFVCAEGHATSDDAFRTPDLRFEEAAEICKPIVRYVRRTRRKVLLDDARREGEFKDNPEVQAMPLRSVLCLPVIKQSRLVGILYLENRLADSVFNATRTLMTELLTSQAAISLENARLHEAEAHARALAEAASRAKDDFLSVVSHELRTPLTAILGWLNILRTTTLEPKRLARALEVMQRNAEAQARIVEDLLDVGRSLTGKLRIDRRIIDLRDMVFAALDAMYPAADAKHLAVDAELGALPCMVNGDPDRLQQVAWNLLSNAVKFTPAGGQITVRLDACEATAELRVTDTGQGITSESLPHVFERFWQQDASTTRAHSGLGLGLSIVANLVKLHGGSCHAASGGLSHGATFTVWLPLVTNAGQNGVPAG